MLLVSLILIFGVASESRAQLAYGLIERKFPTNRFCPIETRYGNLVAFTAPSTGLVRITFVAANQYPNEVGVMDFNDPAIDNVYVVPIAWMPTSFGCDEFCFGDDFATGGDQGAPNYPPASDEVMLGLLPIVEQFHSDPHLAADSPWTGGTWYDDFTAPHGVVSQRYCDHGFDSGSLQLGGELLGNVEVSASVWVDGLTPGETYVVFCWFRVRNTNQTGPIPPATLAILVDDGTVIGDRESSFSALKARFR
jgi:hypothetical protein